MEVSLYEASQLGHSTPDFNIVSIKHGDVRRQGKVPVTNGLGEKTCAPPRFTFPINPADPGKIQIELFETKSVDHVDISDVLKTASDTGRPVSHEITLDGGRKLILDVLHLGENGQKKFQSLRKENPAASNSQITKQFEVDAAAKKLHDYMSVHSLDNYISDLMQTTMREQPANPFAYMILHMHKHMETLQNSSPTDASTGYMNVNARGAEPNANDLNAANVGPPNFMSVPPVQGVGSYNSGGWEEKIDEGTNSKYWFHAASNTFMDHEPEELKKLREMKKIMEEKSMDHKNEIKEMARKSVAQEEQLQELLHHQSLLENHIQKISKESGHATPNKIPPPPQQVAPVPNSSVKKQGSDFAAPSQPDIALPGSVENSNSQPELKHATTKDLDALPDPRATNAGLEPLQEDENKPLAAIAGLETPSDQPRSTRGSMHDFPAPGEETPLLVTAKAKGLSSGASNTSSGANAVYSISPNATTMRNGKREFLRVEKNFEVHISKGLDEKVGLGWWDHGKYLRDPIEGFKNPLPIVHINGNQPLAVHRITADKKLDVWNQQSSGDKVQPGDLLIGVEGAHDKKKMVLEMNAIAQKEEIQFEFARVTVYPLKARDAQNSDLQIAAFCKLTWHKAPGSKLGLDWEKQTVISVKASATEEEHKNITWEAPLRIRGIKDGAQAAAINSSQMASPRVGGPFVIQPGDFIVGINGQRSYAGMKSELKSGRDGDWVFEFMRLGVENDKSAENRRGSA